MPSDCDLLRRYVEHQSEAAFTELVQRHINLVYRAALRRVGRNAHSADDVTQRVFTDLARKAGSLLDRSSLAGWLYTSTRFAAAEVVRTEQRRFAREQRAHDMQDLDSNPTLSVDQLEPLLDEVMDQLSAQDRDAVLLHFFEGQAFTQLGAELSLSPDAARMRVNRALERLRVAFARRGIASTASALAAALTTQSTFAAPASLAATVASHALAQGAALGSSVSALARLAHLTKAKLTSSWVGGAAVVATLGLALFLNRPAIEPVPPVASTNPSPPSASVLAAPNANKTSPPPLAVTAPSFAPPERAASSSAFAQLSDEEKNLLARLWNLEEFSPPKAGTRPGLRVGGQAPNSRGSALLIEKGWAKAPQNGRVIVLTKPGMAFCNLYREEIEAYFHSFEPNRSRPAARTRPDASDPH